MNNASHVNAAVLRIAPHEPEAVFHSCCYRGPVAGRFTAVAHARLAARRYYAACWLAEIPPPCIDIARIFWLFPFLPTFQPTNRRKERKKKRNISLKMFLYFFFFL